MPPIQNIEDQIIYGKLAALNRHTGELLQRISRSILIAESRAYAVGIIDDRAGLVHQIQGEAEHLYALRSSAHAMYDHFAYDIEEGDVIVSADVYKGGTKGQTITMILPVFIDGELILSPVIRAQMTDLAGEYPGGYHPEAFEMWQESMRITPVKLYTAGKLRRDVRRFLLANSRTPELFASDLDAILASLEQAKVGIIKTIKQYGLDKVKQSIEHMKVHSYQQTLSALPQENGIWHARTAVPAEGITAAVDVQLTRQDDKWVFDFTGSSKQVNAPYNCSLATTSACAVTAVLAEHLAYIAINDGLLNAFQFVVPEGSIVAPNYPSATALGYYTTGQAVASSIITALSSDQSYSEKYGAIHGASSLTVLFAPIGTQTETTPLFLEPGFTLSDAGWGPAVLHSGRKLVSAEELEWRSQIRINHRQLNEQSSAMEVELQLLDGQWESCIFVSDQTSGTQTKVQVIQEDQIVDGTQTGIALGEGSVLRYQYINRNNHTDRKEGNEYGA